MARINDPSPWQRLLDALDSGKIDQIRAAVAALDDRGEELLSEHVGGARVERAGRTVRRSRETQRRATGGRVIVIHGIMGAQLDVVDKNGDSDRVWVNYLRLLNGRIGDLELRNGVQPKNPAISVRVAGIFPEYVPLLLELDQSWKVSPFAYDWRLDLDDAAANLAALVKTWAAGEPCHIVAHSMGGLVARRFMQLFPDVWKTMVDPNGRKRGGRLIQLGTPNRGSFAIPLMLTGNEPLVRKLAFLDRKHDVKEIVPVLATFPGPYQMMPAPSTGPDDRNKLYQVGTWGATPPVKQFLDLGGRFHKAMENVVDPDGIVYVAGYDQDTPYRVTVTNPGEFEYEITTNGDGRVPHDLGLLDGVRTLWVDEVHGDLAGNASVLAGIHKLLETGNTVELEQSLPASRRRAAVGKIKAIPPDAAELELQEIAAAGVPMRGRKPLDVAANAERAEALLVRGFVGSPTERSVKQEKRSEVDRVGRERPARRVAKPVKLRMQVVCGDITKVRGDVYAVGHYVGVMPQAAEYALDTQVSAPNAPPHARVLNANTRLRLLRGDLGTVKFFPWADGSGRLVAVTGMGHPGTFGAAELRKLASSLTLEVGALPNAKTICTVLIGSGAGNLAVSTCVRRLLLGVMDALRFERGAARIDTIKIVEREFGKAHEIHEAVKRFTEDDTTAQTLDIDLPPVEIDESAEATPQLVVPSALANLAFAAKPGSRSPVRKSLDELLRNVPGASKRKVEGLAKLITKDVESAADLASRLTISLRPRGDDQQDDRSNPTRFSVVRDRDELVTAALSNTAVVPQRVLRFDLKLFDELAQKATDPLAADAASLGLLVTRLLISSDFMPLLARSSVLVAELDRYTAGLPWELLATNETLDGQLSHLALDKEFARQLRTSYSPAPAAPIERNKLRALVIGDPGDPNVGDDLPGARNEAYAVYDYLHQHNVDVEARIGAPSARRRGRLAQFEPAARLEVLKLLLSGDYDLVHYCGHGDFDEKDPTTTGWLFEGGLLRAHEIERIQRAPRLIVANACLSGRVSDQRENGKPVRRPGEETGLLPSLADEFFRRGVRDYIGTAWEVNDQGAIEFATTLYSKLFAGGTIGAAVSDARKLLYASSDQYDALWAAYQHYGDPNATLFDGPAVAPPSTARGTKAEKKARAQATSVISTNVARSYVADAVLPAAPARKRGVTDGPPIELKDTDAQALVVGSGLVVASENVPAQTRSDIVNCTLFAQLAASGSVPDPSNVTAWYAKYFEALTALGWAQSDSRFEEFKSSSATFEAHEAALKVLTALLGANAAAVALVKQTIEALRDMNENSPWITVFDHQSTAVKSARFQVATAQRGADGLLEIALVAFDLKSKVAFTQVLFFKFKKSATDLRYARGSATIYEAALADNRQQIADRLAAYRAAYIGQVKFPLPPAATVTPVRSKPKTAAHGRKRAPRRGRSAARRR